MNRVILTGRITKDPAVKQTPSGISAVGFTLAVERPFKDANGNKQTDFINCVAWRSQADFIGNYIKKGYMLAVDGQIQTRNYQNQQGQTVFITEVVVDQVENLTPRDQSQQQNNYTDNDLPF